MLTAVTGAFSYSGAAIASELTRRGHGVRTLTNHPQQHSPYPTAPLDLTDHAGLVRSLAGIDVLYNTYWVRFPHGSVTFDTAVAGSKALFDAAAEAGVQRIVHVSITHADPASPLGYFRGKGQVEQHLRECGVPSAIVRPAILFGGDGVLINNIGWLLRRSPLILLGGDGSYRVRGIHIDDLARLMADLGEATTEATVDAVGPQSLTFRELVMQIRTAIDSHAVIAPVPKVAFPAVTAVLGTLLGDTLLTREEFVALSSGLADSTAPTTGSIRLTDWIAEHSDSIGRVYAHELRRHFTPVAAVGSGS